MSVNYIVTKKNNCQDCYKCIRECHVKAIKIEEQSASIIDENCIYCGHCTTVCPVGAKKVKEDISTVRYLLKNHNRVCVSLAPAWVTEFPEFDHKQMVALLKLLGFSFVSETALGAEIVSGYVARELSQQEKGIFISPCCPSLIELIQKYYPQYSDNILKVDTPMLVHGKFLREHYGNDIKVVFIGPCFAKKKEADMNQGIIDAAITFSQLRKWMEEEELLDELPVPDDEDSFVPYAAGKGIVYPVSGGMIAGVKKSGGRNGVSYMSFTGIKTIVQVLGDLNKLGDHAPVFLELMICDEGCINGPGTSQKSSVAVKRMAVLDRFELTGMRTEDINLKSSIYNSYSYIVPVVASVYTEKEIRETLKSVGKQNKNDELNCGGCGYECCVDFARAVLNGKAERKMCVSYMRRVAQDKATVLLQRMPYGVVIVDRNLRVVESNRIFAEMAGEDAVLAFEAKPGLEGADLTRLIPFHHYFRNLFDSHETTLEKDIYSGTQFMHLSMFSIDGRNLMCAILHNLRDPELKREEIIKRIRTVTRENLKTVQKIAFHLGENASSMETLLNSIVDIQNENYEE